MRSHRLFRSIAIALGCLAAACSSQSAASTAAPATPAAQEPQLPAPEAMVARAKALEIKTPYVPPPGNPSEHHTSGFAKTMCSAVFITGLDPDVAAESVGYFTGPYEERKKVGKPVVDRVKKEVRITIPNGPTLVARYFGSQGCITLPPGKDDLFFKPKAIKSSLPDPTTTAWPMGDVLESGSRPAYAPAKAQELQRGLAAAASGREGGQPASGIDLSKVTRAIDTAFEPSEALTSAFVVTHKGQLIGERYMPGITHTTPLESWSMGKSVTATMMGVLIKQGAYTLDQPAPIPEWQSPGDPRQQIRISDILRMSSGIRIKAPGDPGLDLQGGYPDHLYLYTGRVNSFTYAATRPQEWPPNTVGRYRNTDPVLTNYLIRLAVEKRGEDYLSFPQRNLFDKIGIRSMVMETDPYGNFLTQGYELMSGRDWARLGNLYLQDGVWNGERILPEGFVRFVSTVAPAWSADKRMFYGGFFWVNGDGRYPVPKEAFYMSGAGGQTVLIIPSHDLVVVRIGHYKGQREGGESFGKALKILMEAVPPKT